MKRLLGLIVGLIFALPAISAGLPSGYTELEYIQSDGNQYITTDIVADTLNGVEIEFTILNDMSAGTSLFGGRAAGNLGQGVNVGHSADKKITVDWFDGTRYTSSVVFEKNIPYRLVIQNNIYTLYNKTTGAVLDTHTFNVNTKDDKYTLALFGLNNGGTGINSRDSVRMTKVQLYVNSNNVSHNLVPAKYGNTVGMYDTVGGRFYTDANGGNFTGGRELDSCRNLFDVNNVEIQNNTAIGSDGSLATNGAVNTCVTYIPVQPNTTYTISGNALSNQVSGSSGIAYFRLAQYNSSKQFISRSDGVEGTSYTFTTGANTYYIRFHYANADADLRTYQLKLSSCNTFVETPNVCASFDVEKVYKVGTPTITNTGVYTTNASTSFIRTQGDVNFSNANFWSFKWRFTYHPSSTDQGIMSGDGGTNIQAIINSEGRPRFSFGSTRDTWDIGAWNDSSISFRYQDGVTYDNEIYFNGTRYGYKVDGVEIGGLDSIKKAANTYFAIGVERQRTANQYTHSEWDLTHTTLTVNGVEQLAWCISPIKIATTKYNTNAFSSVVTALSNAVDTIKTVVANTINQATAVANLQSGKQTMPDSTATNGTCPNYKQCLLVEDNNGTPHWYVITDPFRDFVTPIIANGTNPNSYVSNAGYTQLEYIESDGTQWIDTGVAPTQLSFENAEIFVDGQYVSATTGQYNYAALWGTQSSATWFKTDIKTASQIAVQAGGSNKETKVTVSDALARHQIKMDSAQTKCYVDGTAYDLTVQQSVFTLQDNITLFKSNGVSSGQYATARIYKMYIKSNGSLVRNFVPVRQNSTGKYGMYDKVNNVFYPNANTASGATDFTPGPEVINQDPAIPGMRWTATWNANANSGIAAGTINAVSRCASVGASANYTYDSPSLLSTLSAERQAQWATPFDSTTIDTYTMCWCKVNNVVSGNETLVADKTEWMFYLNLNTALGCAQNCARYCVGSFEDRAPFRKTIFGM